MKRLDGAYEVCGAQCLQHDVKELKQMRRKVFNRRGER